MRSTEDTSSSLTNACCFENVAHLQGQYVWYNHPEETWSPARVTEGGTEDISIEMVDGGLVGTQPHVSACCLPHARNDPTAHAWLKV